MQTAVKGALPDRPTLVEMVEELLDLSVGLGTVLLPLLILAVPGAVLFVALPGILLLVVAGAPVAIAAAIIGPPYMLFRLFRRRRDQAA